MPVRVQTRFRIVTHDETVLCNDVIAWFDGADRQPKGICLSLIQGEDRAGQSSRSPLRLRQWSFPARHRCCEARGRSLQSKVAAQHTFFDR
jgi:hypothetical protein